MGKDILFIPQDAPIYHDYQWDVKRITKDLKSHEINPGNHGTVVGVIDTCTIFDI